MRGVAWVAVPTTLVGQVDAAIGGKTAVDLPDGKNLVGAFHWPARVVVDPGTLETLPDAEHRNGMAEVVKTGLLMGEAVWELPLAERVRRCAAYKAGGLASPIRTTAARGTSSTSGTRSGTRSRRRRGTGLPHGQAVALGMVAALQLSGNEDALAAVRKELDPKPVRVDREAAWAALARDKKTLRRYAPARPPPAPRASRRGATSSRRRTCGAALDGLIAD